MKWGNKIARISNHIHYHDRSALREAMRFYGFNKFISKNMLTETLNKMEPDIKLKIEKKKRNLMELSDIFLCTVVVLYFFRMVSQMKL